MYKVIFLIIKVLSTYKYKVLANGVHTNNLVYVTREKCKFISVKGFSKSETDSRDYLIQTYNIINVQSTFPLVHDIFF